MTNNHILLRYEVMISIFVIGNTLLQNYIVIKCLEINKWLNQLFRISDVRLNFDYTHR